MSGRDYQRSRVYAWEHSLLPQYDKSKVPFDKIAGLVQYIWKEEGLLYPPRVEALPKHSTMLGTGSRTRVRFPSQEPTSTWVILHELAHAMLGQVELNGHQSNEQHNDKFVGMVIKLYHKYIRIDMLVLTSTATKARLDFDLAARPLFLD